MQLHIHQLHNCNCRGIALCNACVSLVSACLASIDDITEKQLHNNNARGVNIPLHAHTGQLHNHNCRGINFGRIPTPTEIKLALPLPPSKKRTAPLKRRILWAWGFFSRSNQKLPGAHKIGAAISGPRITGGKLRT